MTDRLSQLLHDEAADLDVPPPAATAVLRRGRRIRRTHTLAVVGATAAALAVIGGGVALASGVGEDRAVEPAPAPAPATSADAVFAIGNTVYFADGTRHASIDDPSVKSLYYTSAGVLVRHGENPWSDGGGPQRFSLVTPEGDVRPIAVETEETVHATDPDQPYLAYAETVDGTTSVVVHDLTDDTEAARVALPDGLEWGGWSAPPVAISGDHVYVGTDDVARVVDWRTGEITESEGLPPGYPEVAGGRTTVADESGVRVIDVTDGGTTLLEIPVERGYPMVDLSPDGRYVAVSDQMGDGPLQVFEVDSGAHVTFDDGFASFGWSPAGELFGVDGTEFTTCSPTTGDCESTRVQLEKEPSPAKEPAQLCDKDGCRPQGPPADYSGELKLGGRTYES